MALPPRLLRGKIVAEMRSADRRSRSTTRLKKSIVDDAPLPPKGRRTMLWDNEVKGFGVRITASGTRTYLLRYRMGGRDTPIREVTIGQHGSPWTTDQARRRAIEFLMQVRSGHDPVAEREAERRQSQADVGNREERMFGAKAEEWFRKHVQRDGLRSQKDIRGVLDRDLKPAFAGKTIDEITKKDVTDALDAIGDRSGSAANKAHKWGRQIFNWLKDERGELDRTPMDGVKRPFPEPSRTRVLSLPELVVLWVALDGLTEPFRSFYRFLILIGQRLREGANAPWNEFDFEAGDWFLPKARTKADRDHLVPMSEQAIEILEDIQPDPAKRKGPVFTTNGKVGISGFSKLKLQIGEEIERLLLESPAARELTPDGIPDWVIHDLRRSLATGCQGLGIDLNHSEAVLNHAFGKTLSGVAPVYHLHEYYNEKAEALTRWGELIEKAVACFCAGDVEGVRALDPARRTRTRRRRRPRRGAES
ncbi:site-specific integrase [Sphingomonas koreensis]|nr:site-specific integrase [Sphingomonas koreensis]